MSEEDIVAIFMDGKSFADNEIVIAVDVTMELDQRILGMVETHTENHKVCQEFLQTLIERGLRDGNKILFIIDVGKGLRKGILNVFRDQALIRRCQWHKREIEMAYLPKSQQVECQKKLRKA